MTAGDRPTGGQLTGELTAVVTGAASPRGIGRAVALRFAAEGRPAALLDRDADGLEQAAAAVRSAGAAGVATAVVDIADAASVDRAVTAIEQELPPIAALVNCAGISNPTPFNELTVEDWERTLRINATGTFLMCHRIVPGMRERRHGRIVTLSSTAAQDGGGNYSKTAYVASKAAIEGLTRGLAVETARDGVTVNAIAPANIDTDIMGGPLVGERRRQFVDRMPVGRLGTVEELAELVAFLCGRHGGFTTGATYNLNGGLRIG